MAGSAVIGALRVNLGLNSAEFESGLKNVKAQFGAFSKMFAGLAAAGVFTAFSAGIGQAVGRIEEMRKLSSQLDRALANTGNTAKTSASEVAGFADELERSTGRAAEEVMALSTNLATFGFSREVFFDAIELADDMAAAWGGDLKQNAEGLARALADPEQGLAMLTKRGITFTDEQKKMIAGFMKANDLVGAQGVIMDALNEQVKGVAAAGFTGLTKATANAWKGLDDFFEGIATGLQVNLGLELALVGVAEALRFVTDNLGVMGRAIAVAGAAMATAMGPAIWTAMSTAAVAFGQAAVGAIRAVGIAIASNPIGAIVVALSAAVSAAFLFRDEIKQAIGIDFVGIAQGAANNFIGLFVGAYKAVTGAFALLPDAFGAIFTRAMNESIKIVQSGVNGIAGALRNIPGLGGIQDVNLKDWLRPEGNGLGNLLDTVQNEFQAGFSRDYFAELGSLFSGVGEGASDAAANVKGFSDILDQSASGGGGLSKIKDAAAAATTEMKGLGDVIGDVLANSRSAFASMGTSIVRAFGDAENGITKALNAIGSALDNIADKAMNDAFGLIYDVLTSGLKGALGGNPLSLGAGGAGFLGGGPQAWGGIKGLATTGRTMSAGLVEVGERGRELLALPAGAQVMRHTDIGDLGGSASRLEVSLSPELVASILEQAQGQAVTVVRANDKARKNFVEGGGTAF